MNDLNCQPNEPEIYDGESEMEIVKRFARESLVYSYDVDAISLLPWEGVNVP